MQFPCYRQCTKCSLHETATHPGIPTRSFPIDLAPTEKWAVLFVGQSPGANEDKQGKSFIGYTGGLLDKFIKAAGLEERCDVYVANACRCRPPQSADVSQAQIRACRDYLIEDIATLQAYYEEVVLVALGAKACYSLTNISSLSEGFKKQGMCTKLNIPPAEGQDSPRVFFTYHPAMLHPTRDPAKIYAVEAHFQLLLRYLDGEFIPNSLNVNPLVGILVPADISQRITLDIETYGILAGIEQTVFNPHKSKFVDGIDYENQIVTLSFGYRNSAGDLQTALYRWDVPSHRRHIRRWFRRISTHSHLLTGQNIKFDLAYLIASGDKELQYWIQPGKIQLDDTLLLSFLHYEQRPEKALKELAVLFGITDYSDLKVTGKSGTAKSSGDKDLHLYNCTDAAATFVLAEELTRLIEEKWGPQSPKLSKTCSDMKNMVIWDTLELELNGSSFDLDKLQAFHFAEDARCKEIVATCKDKYGVIVTGDGSERSQRGYLTQCLLAADLLDDIRIAWTPKTKVLALTRENMNMVIEYLDPDIPESKALRLMIEYKERSKLVSTYTKPILNQPSKGIVTRDGNVGMVWPSWYPIPSYIDRGGGSDTQKGQIQGRFSCSKPARLTEPKAIRQMSRSRWVDGILVEYDVNQDHLRMAALLSGDPCLMSAYQKEGGNIHLQTAAFVFPEKFCPDFKNKYPAAYKLCKNLNFLVLFRGGPLAYQREARDKVGVELPLSFCQDVIDKWYEAYHVYGCWQDEMVSLAERQGYLELPTGWSRTFGPPRMDLSAWEGEVLNFLHQCPCAQITQSAQFQIQTQLRNRYHHSRVCLEIYDAIFVDVFPGEETIVDEIVHEAMTHPPMLAVFEQWAGRSVPWAYERIQYGSGKSD